MSQSKSPVREKSLTLVNKKSGKEIKLTRTVGPKPDYKKTKRIA